MGVRAGGGGRGHGGLHRREALCRPCRPAGRGCRRPRRDRAGLGRPAGPRPPGPARAGHPRGGGGGGGRPRRRAGGAPPAPAGSRGHPARRPGQPRDRRRARLPRRALHCGPRRRLAPRRRRRSRRRHPTVDPRDSHRGLGPDRCSGAHDRRTQPGRRARAPGADPAGRPRHAWCVHRPGPRAPRRGARCSGGGARRRPGHARPGQSVPSGSGGEPRATGPDRHTATATVDRAARGVGGARPGHRT